MKTLLFFPFFLQATAIFIDEIYFHIRRGLPRWERIGHPLDTATVLICLLFILLVPYSADALKWYIALSLFSCLMVTKDEWVHKEHCPALENWLHALLFLNHPLVLSLSGLFWWSFSWPELHPWIPGPELLRPFLILQTAGVAFFMSYQIFYWNFLARPILIRELSHQPSQREESMSVLEEEDISYFSALKQNNSQSLEENIFNTDSSNLENENNTPSSQQFMNESEQNN